VHSPYKPVRITRESISLQLPRLIEAWFDLSKTLDNLICLKLWTKNVVLVVISHKNFFRLSSLDVLLLTLGTFWKVLIFLKIN